MQAVRWSDNNAALAVRVLTSGLTWVLEWPCLVAFEDLESRIGRREKVQGPLATWGLATSAEAVTPERRMKTCFLGLDLSFEMRPPRCYHMVTKKHESQLTETMLPLCVAWRVQGRGPPPVRAYVQWAIISTTTTTTTDRVSPTRPRHRHRLYTFLTRPSVPFTQYTFNPHPNACRRCT